MTDGEVIFLRSSKTNCNSVEGSSTNQDDIWDDTLLIKAYDNAFKLSQQNYSKLSQNHENEAKIKAKKKVGEQKWKVGDRCRCQYTEDLKYYEADIIEIVDSTGLCIVKYVGYENEEEVPLKKLKQSAGEHVRMAQCKQALEDYGIPNAVETDKTVHNNLGHPGAPSAKKKPNSTKKEQLKNKHFFGENNSFPPIFPLPQLGNSIIPPPPPPHLFNQFKQDDIEAEAMSAMLMSWYMSGYHTGYYQGLKMAKKQ